MQTNDLLANFLEPSTEILDAKKAKLAPKFGRQTLGDDGGEQELLERLSNFSSHSSKSKSKRNLPRPSEMTVRNGQNGDDLLTLIQNDHGMLSPTPSALFFTHYFFTFFPFFVDIFFVIF